MADDVMTYRITVKEYAIKEGWHATFMPKPLEGENGSGMHTHLSLTRGEGEAFLDDDDPYGLSAGRPRLHRRPAAPRARAVVDLRPVGQLLQAARAGLRGAGLRRVEPAQPLGARPRPAARRAHGAALPGPGVQPVPDVRRPAPGRPRGRSRRATSCPSRWRRTSTTCRPTTGAGWGSSSCPRRSARRSRSRRESELVLRTLGEHMFNRFVEIKRQEWEDYRVQVTRWELDRYLPVLVAGGARSRAAGRRARRRPGALEARPRRATSRSPTTRASRPPGSSRVRRSRATRSSS